MTSPNPCRSPADDDRPGVVADAAAVPSSPLRAILRYTAARVALFVLAAGLVWLVRVRGVLLVLLGLLISGLASFVLLRRQRQEMAEALRRTRLFSRSGAASGFDEAACDELPRSYAPSPDGAPRRSEDEDFGNQPRS